MRTIYEILEPHISFSEREGISARESIEEDRIIGTGFIIATYDTSRPPSDWRAMHGASATEDDPSLRLLQRYRIDEIRDRLPAALHAAHAGSNIDANSRIAPCILAHQSQGGSSLEALAARILGEPANWQARIPVVGAAFSQGATSYHLMKIQEQPRLLRYKVYAEYRAIQRALTEQLPHD